MNNKKQKIALFTVGLLFAVSLVSGLILPYMQNRDKETVQPGGQQGEKITVPDFTFTDAEVNTVHFDDFKGKPIVINLWGTWCPWCVEEMADFNQLAGEYGEDVNFLFLDVATDADETVEAVQQYLADNEYNNITSYYDSMYNACYMFGVNSFPTTIYVDSDGYLYDVTIGLTNYDAVKLTVEAMLG